MTFEYRDAYGRVLTVNHDLDDNDNPMAVLWSRGEYGVSVPVRIPADRVEEVIAGIRDAARAAAARQTTGQDDTEAVSEAERVCALPDWAACSCNHLTGCEKPHPAVGQPAEAQATDSVRWDGTAVDATRVIDWILAHGGTATYACQDSAQCSASDGATSHHISIRTADGTAQANPGARIALATTWTVEDETR